MRLDRVRSCHDMPRTALEFLHRVEQPWVTVREAEPESRRWIHSHFYGTDDGRTCVRVLRGSAMRTMPALMSECRAAFQFGGNFKGGWHALEEHLSYLDEFVPANGYVVIIEEGDQVLADEPIQTLQTFVHTLH